MGMTTKQILQGVHDWTDDNFGRKDGFYEQLVSGSALALIGQTQRTNDAMYRKSGNPEQVITGDAIITKIQGQTKEWNQLVRLNEINFSPQTIAGLTISATNGYIHIAGTATTSSLTRLFTLITQLPIISTHKYFCRMMGSNKRIISFYFGSGIYFPYYGTEYKDSIQSGVDAATVQSIYIKPIDGVTYDDYFYPQIIDLTIMFGAGNEPTSSAEFRADYEKCFGKPLDYEAYDAGSLRSVQLESLKTTGFNQWDEQWEVGSINSDGTPMQYEGVIRTKYDDPIKVLGNTIYYFKCSFQCRICYYDSNDKFISRSTYLIANTTFTTPVGCKYLRIAFIGDYGTQYKHDTCINISDSARNGEYEPYEKHVAPIPVTTLKGKLNGEGESVTIFPDGMNKFDSLYTQSDKTYAIVGGETRAYQEGDVTSETMVTDGVAHTYVALATPLVYEVEGFTLPKTYLVDGGGTEEQVQKANVQGLAAILTCIYGVDAVGILDKLPRNYISEASMDNFLAKLNIATGGTWSKTFNENTGEWDFSFQRSEETNANTNEESI